MKKHFRFSVMAALAAFAFAACEEVPELPYNPEGGEEDDTTEIGGVKTLPYSESFSSSLGDWTNQTTSGEGAWINDYSTAKATGYDNASKVTTAGTYYLVSPEISLEGVTEAHASFEYILRYNKADENQKMLISADYTDDATTATWIVLSEKHTEGRDWTTFESADINIPAEYMGKLIRIAFYYNTNDVSGSTWEVRNFAIAEGKATEGGNNEEEKPEATGDTLSVKQAIALNDGEKHWVKGYIVGYISQSYVYTFTADANASETNLLIADTKDCTDEASCMPVQLPAGSIRSALNLKANPENLGKVLTINGQLTNYFKVPGIKSASEYKLEGEGNNDTPDTPETPTDAYYSNTLLGNDGGFVAYDVNLGSLNYVWQNTTSYGWKASAFTNDTAVAAESWLVSPAIDLSAAKNPVMTFEQALNHLKGASRTAHTNAYIATDFAGDIASATWEEITFDEWPAGADWTFITSTADLATYAGKSIHIAFKYVSTSAVAPTWEFKNLTIAEK